MLECYIEGKNIVEGSEQRYGIAEGAVFIDNYNETLDTATIIVPHLKSKIDIEPYDIINIEDESENIADRHMLVDTVQCRQVCLDPEIYDYTITLFSMTKMLEGVLCPSMSITKRMNGTPITIEQAIQNLLDQYSPKHSSSATLGAYGNLIVLGHNAYNTNETFSAKFGVECPEMQWNEPSLREAITDLMLSRDCIPAIRYQKTEGRVFYRLDFINIASVGSEISQQQRAGINYIQESQSSEDYVSEIKMNLKNATNGGSQDTATRTVEKIGFRNDESYLLTTENIRLQTSFPIWKVHHFYALCDRITVIFNYMVYINGQPYDPGSGVYESITVYNRKVDLTEFLLEHNEWLTKNVYYGAWDLNTTGLDSNYRNRCLYYSRGSKNVLNFNEKTTNQFLWIEDSLFVWQMICMHRALSNAEMRELADIKIAEMNAEAPEGTRYEFLGFAMGYPTIAGNPTHPENLKFELDYEPLSESVMSVSKMPIPTNKRQIVDNQTNPYVNVERQGLLEYMKANRLGNRMKLINGRYSGGESPMPRLAQKVGGSVIFSKEMAVYDNHINVNYKATDNYVLRDYYTGIKSKLRSWKIVSGSDAFVRADLIKFYVGEEIPSVNNTNMVIPSYDTITEYMNNFKYCLIQFKYRSYGYVLTKPTPPTIDGTTITEANAIAVEFVKNKIGTKAAVFTIKMNDNYYAGNYISNLNGENGRIEQKGIGYADNNGEIVGGTVCFYDAPPAEIATYGQQLKPYAHMVKRGEAGDGHLVCQIPFSIKKDNKEIFQLSIQFERNDYANDIFLGKK